MTLARIAGFVMVRLLLWVSVSLVPLVAAFPKSSLFSLGEINYEGRLGEVIFAVVPGGLLAMSSAIALSLTSHKARSGWLASAFVINLLIVAGGCYALSAAKVRVSEDSITSWLIFLVLGLTASFLLETQLSLIWAREANQPRG